MENATSIASLVRDDAAERLAQLQLSFPRRLCIQRARPTVPLAAGTGASAVTADILSVVFPGTFALERVVEEDDWYRYSSYDHSDESEGSPSELVSALAIACFPPEVNWSC